MINNNKIAIVGMSFKYPHINSADDFVKYLSEGSFVPNDGWKDRGALLHVAEYNKLVGQTPLMKDIEYFDSKFFNVVQKEALEMAPEMKLTLTHSILSVYDAGYSLSDIRNSECGMVLACSSTSADYRKLTPNGSSTAYLDTRETMIGCKLSYYFGFSGPFFALDSTCSSSLLALKQASEVLSSHQADMMIAGGVQLFLPNDAKRAHELLLGTESVRDAYIPFDEKAVNLTNGEGAAFVLLRRYEDAVRDGDSIYGVITGCGMCGTSGESRISPYATDAQSQCKAIKRAWNTAGVNADDITEVEAHGSATEIGDKSEVDGFALAMKERTVADKVLLSSVKSNIGHTSQCAGVSGLIKVLLGFMNDTAYPIANFTEPKKSLDFEKAHLLPIGKPVNFSPNTHRVAGISGYGLNSLNVHIIVENCEKYSPSVRNIEKLNHVLKLSAKTKTSFNEYVQKVKQAISSADDLNDIIYTLNRGRDDFRIRTAVYFENKEQLIEALDNISANDFGEENIVKTVDKTSSNPAHEAYELIINGYTVDFLDYYKNSEYRRVHTVPYQFDKLYTWIVEKEAVEFSSTSDADTTSAKTSDINIKAEMQKIWQEVLETEDEISDEDTFFELGGNSMLASVLIESINEKFDCGFEFGDIYTYSAFGQMCEFAENNSSAESVSDSKTEDVTTQDISTQNISTQEVSEQENRIDIKAEMQKIWQSVLETEDEISDEDTFFELGGNSMLASVLIESINEKFDCGFEFGDIYTYSAFGQMCEFAENNSSAKLVSDSKTEYVTTQDILTQEVSEQENRIDIKAEMQNIWQEVLETEDEISDEDTFFELGGNSMLASVLIESINEKFDCGFEFGDIYTYSAFGQMCEFVREKEN